MRLMRRLSLPAQTRLLVVSVAVGLLTGVGVYVFRRAIDVFHLLFAQQLSLGVVGGVLARVGLPPQAGIVVGLALAGLVVGGLMQRFVGHEPLHGVSGVMLAVNVGGGRLPYRKMPVKAAASALSLGAGASVGPEDPSVQIGSNIGSWVGLRLGLSEEQVRVLVAAGAASAIAAAFNAPIAGVFFAIEVILVGELLIASTGMVVLAAVVASAFTQAVRDTTPIFGDLAYTLGSPAELPFYALLGVLLAGASWLAIRFLVWNSAFIHDRVRLPLPLKAALTGAVVGVVGVFLPQLLGPGEEAMHDVLSGHAHHGLVLLLLLGVLKVVLTGVSQAGGFVGGLFAPTLFVGIMFGSAFGQLLGRVTPPALVGDPQAYSIAGMAGMLAGVVRAPITAILLVFELTDDYRMILPIMLTTVLCALLLEQNNAPGIYHLFLQRYGVRLRGGRDVDVMQGVTVREAMQQPAPSIAASASLAELRAELQRQQARALCVVDDGTGALVGIVTLGDLQRAYAAASATPDAHHPTVGDVCTRDVARVGVDDGLWQAVRVMGARDVGRLPVLAADGALVGLVRRHDVMRAYNTAIQRKQQEQVNTEQIRLNTMTGAHVLHIRVQPSMALAGQAIRDISWPPEAIVASVERGGKLLVPRGNTVLRPHDKLTIITDPQGEADVRTLFQPKASTNP